MKTSLKILIVLMSISTLWQACQFDIVNTVISAVSIPLLILGYSFLTYLENAPEKPI